MPRPASRLGPWIRPAIVVLALASAPALRSQGRPVGEWPTYGGDLASSKYSPLSQIDGANVSALRVAWRAPSPDGQLTITTPDGG